MKLSTRGRYGTRAVLELALNEGQGPISLKQVARNQEISVQYLEHLITPLIEGGIIKSTRGARGGISLAKPAENIRVIEILQLLEGQTSLVDCLEKPETCDRGDYCSVKDFWNTISFAIDGVLGKINLRELAERQKKKEFSQENMYYI